MSKNTTTLKTKPAKEYLKEPYARVLIPEADGSFSGEILEFPGCYAVGNSAEETLENLNNTAESWIEVLLDRQQEIPQAFANYEGSGKVLLRLPRGTHHRAVQAAAMERTSLNSFIVGAIEARLGAIGASNQILKRIEKLLLERATTNITKNVKWVAFNHVAHTGFTEKANAVAAASVVFNRIDEVK